jgi:hypothetical protein
LLDWREVLRTRQPRSISSKQNLEDAHVGPGTHLQDHGLGWILRNQYRGCNSNGDLSCFTHDAKPAMVRGHANARAYRGGQRPPLSSRASSRLYPGIIQGPPIPDGRRSLQRCRSEPRETSSAADPRHRTSPGRRYTPCPGGNTTTGAPVFTRLKRSIASSLVIRMHPDEMARPIYSG